MGRDFGWLWRAYTISAAGTWLALDAFPLIAILALHTTPAQVSLLAAVGGAMAALLALPLGPWVEFRRKRPLMIHADLLRFLILLTVPVAYLLGMLTYGQLLVVTVGVAVADIVFFAASGAHLKALVPKEHLVAANGKFENVMWTSSAVGPPLGGGLLQLLGPVITTILNAVSFLLSALAIRMIKAPEPEPPAKQRDKTGIAEGWRAITKDPNLRGFFIYSLLTNGLIMATAPLLLYWMVRELNFTTLQYGLALGISCLGGVLGARMSRSLVNRFGQRRILLGFGIARVIWVPGLVFIQPGLVGLLVFIGVEFTMIVCMGIFNPVLAAHRLQRANKETVSRVLTAWTISSRATIAALTALWGVLGSLTSSRTAIAIAGVLLLLIPLSMPWRRQNWESTESASANDVTTAAT
ncbi:MFS transporter [Kibdelosporangium philippinense]|uniref:MFS transporter n=1 Tax=Kibdelosporangium philippinense TaxID=211113 RepID=A0ABS8ZBJ0_9PSEU|nr:MFS transporter [Kibdelosporangium philippinense]MCE7004195.1 MFS transporter [Kibdelosporangium philippinense]